MSEKAQANAKERLQETTEAEDVEEEYTWDEDEDKELEAVEFTCIALSC